MVINSTNAQLIAGICGSEETDDWAGHQVVCYTDPNISFAGKIVGGIRVRAPRLNPAPAAPQAHPAQRAQAPAPAKPTAAESDYADSEVPF